MPQPLGLRTGAICSAEYARAPTSRPTTALTSCMLWTELALGTKVRQDCPSFKLCWQQCRQEALDSVLVQCHCRSPMELTSSDLMSQLCNKAWSQLMGCLDISWKLCAHGHVQVWRFQQHLLLNRRQELGGSMAVAAHLNQISVNHCKAVVLSWANVQQGFMGFVWFAPAFFNRMPLTSGPFLPLPAFAFPIHQGAVSLDAL